MSPMTESEPLCYDNEIDMHILKRIRLLPYVQ